MKLSTVLLIVAASFCLFATSSYAKAVTYEHAISGDPIDFLIGGVFNATYEQHLNGINSFTVYASYYSYATWWKAYGIGGSYRWYPDWLKDTKNPIEGLSVGPMINVSFWSWGGSGLVTYNGGTNVVIGGEAAYKWVWGGFMVEPILRIGFNVASVSGLGYNPFGGGVNVGYSW